MNRSALLVHGFASTFEATWGEVGWPDLLADLDIEVVAFELPGHGASPLPGDLATADAARALLDAGRQADVALGFSAGSALLLRAAVADPNAFDRLVLLGIGDGMWKAPGALETIGDDLLAEGGDEGIRLLRSMAQNAGNRLDEVAAYARASTGPPALAELAAVTARTLVVLGEGDSAGPADALLAALPDARLALLPHVDHYRTPSTPSAMAAVLAFLES